MVYEKNRQILNPMLTKLIISEYLIKSTGADGGHKYISTEIELEGKAEKAIQKIILTLFPSR